MITQLILDEHKRIIQHLVSHRIKSSLSHVQLAEMIGTSQSTISNIESLKSFPSLSMLIRYADAVGARIEITQED